MVLHKCNHLDNEALPMLVSVKDSLEELRVSCCDDIEDWAIKNLANLDNLHHLLLFDLPQVKDSQHCVRILKSALPLPNCEIKFPYTQASVGESG